LAYAVDVQYSGNYTIRARVSMPGRGGVFHIEAAGSDISGPIVVPDTGGYFNWTMVEVEDVPLSAGIQVLTVVMDGGGSGGAVGVLDSLVFSYESPPTSRGAITASVDGDPFGGLPRPVPGQVQFEDFDEGGEGVAYADGTPGNAGGSYRFGEDVDVYRVGSAENGHCLGYARRGEWVNYTVNVEAGGTYTVEARVSMLGPGGTFHIEAAGVDITGPLNVPDTGGYQRWTVIGVSGVGLSAGEQVLTVVMDAGGVGGAIGLLDSLTFTREPGGDRGTDLFSLAEPDVPDPDRIDVYTSGGHAPHADGQALVDGDEETVWSGVPDAGGWWIVLGYGTNVAVRSVELVWDEPLPRDFLLLGSENTWEWFDLALELEQTNSSTVGYLWFVFPDDGSGKPPRIHEIYVE
jgi:hypothetical protein